MNLFYLFISSLGFLDAAFLTNQHYTRDPFVCPLFGGCADVTSSVYSEVLGIPVALFGAIYYGVIFCLSLITFLSDNKKFLKLAAGLSIFGFLASLVLVYLQVYVIQKICFYCMMSAVSSTLLFLCGYNYLKVKLDYKKLIFVALRVSLGFLFLWPFINLLPGWISGNSPTTGFLLHSTKGIFAGFFQSLANNTIVDALYMFGLFAVGTALVLGIYKKLAAIGGTIMLILFYAAALPPEHNPIIDEHIIYILVLWVLCVVDFGAYGRRAVNKKGKKKA